MSKWPEARVSDDVSPSASIGNRIRVARMQLGMTQAQFAVAVNVHKASLSSLETGARPRKDTVEKIAAFLNRPVHDLDPDSSCVRPARRMASCRSAPNGMRSSSGDSFSWSRRGRAVSRRTRPSSRRATARRSVVETPGMRSPPMACPWNWRRRSWARHRGRSPAHSAGPQGPDGIMESGHKPGEPQDTRRE